MILSPNQLNNIGVVILSAGRGARLNCDDRPKVMLEVGGQPIVSYIVENLKKLGFTKEQIVMVVGFKKEEVYNYFGGSVNYAWQEEQLGTAHATYVGMKKFDDQIKDVLIFNGDDSLFYQMNTIINFIEKHIKSGFLATLLTAEIESNNFGYGRVINKNNVFQIIEKEYLTTEDARHNETNTGTFIFNKEWFLREFPNMPKIEKLGEYGLPTAFTLVQKQGYPVNVIKLENKNEWFGINTPEELAIANLRFKNKD